jgi:hypothetical protein
MWDCVCGAFQPFLSRSWGKPEISSILVENGSETAEERLEKRPSFGQGHGQRFVYMWLPIVGSFIAIKVGGGENDQLA